MNSPTVRALILGVAVVAALAVGPASPATAATSSLSASHTVSASPSVTAAVHTSAEPVAKAKKAKKFKNCTALTKVYKGGVAKPGVKANKVGGKKKPFKVKPTYSSALYKANSHLDRDKDGIACEK